MERSQPCPSCACTTSRSRSTGTPPAPIRATTIPSGWAVRSSTSGASPPARGVSCPPRTGMRRTSMLRSWRKVPRAWAPPSWAATCSVPSVDPGARARGRAGGGHPAVPPPGVRAHASFPFAHPHAGRDHVLLRHGVPAASRDDRRPHWPPIRRDAALLDLRQRKSRDGKGQLRGEAGTTLVKLRVDDQQTVTRSRNGGREHQRWVGPRRDDACARIVTR